jgi:cytochrome c biogenesis protein CcmG/thiol:disulfide interchange protein DsbE
MRMRWIVAAVGAIGLAAVTVTTLMPWTQTAQEHADADRHAISAEACPADAAPANFDFTLKDVNGKNVSLSDYKGKVILLDFWATWCAPCKVEIPGFIDFQNRFGSDGFQVIGVSVDDTPDLLTPYIEEMKINYPILQGLGRDDILEAYGPVIGLPTTVLISREGRVCATHSGLTAKEVFEEQIKALL